MAAELLKSLFFSLPLFYFFFFFDFLIVSFSEDLCQEVGGGLLEKMGRAGGEGGGKGGLL